VTEALIALASNYMSLANRLRGGASKKPEEKEQEKDLLFGFGD
jgi:hypothetical protein